MKKNRRIFLKNSLTLGAVASTSLLASSSEDKSNGVVLGNSKKKEILYKKTKEWQKYYKIVY